MHLPSSLQESRVKVSELPEASAGAPNPYLHLVRGLLRQFSGKQSQGSVPDSCGSYQAPNPSTSREGQRVGEAKPPGGLCLCPVSPTHM